MGFDLGISEVAIGALALSAVGTAVSVVGQMQNAAAQQKVANYQAQVAENNALLAKEQAKQTTAAGEAATMQQQMKTRATVGAIRAAQGASGVDVDTGSNVDVRSSAAELGQLDALTIRSNAARQAYGYETGATSQQAQAGLDRAAGAQAGTAGLFGAAGSLLSGASSIASQYTGWKLAAGSGLNSSPISDLGVGHELAHSNSVIF